MIIRHKKNDILDKSKTISIFANVVISSIIECTKCMFYYY